MPRRRDPELPTDAWCTLITNVGDQAASVGYGTAKEDIAVGSAVAKSWLIGNDTLNIATNGSEKLMWNIYSGDEGRLCVSVSGPAEPDGTRETGAVHIMRNNARFDVWICNNSVVIENEERRLASEFNEEACRFFLLTGEGIIESNDPACMLNYMFEYSYD